MGRVSGHRIKKSENSGKTIIFLEEIKLRDISLRL